MNPFRVLLALLLSGIALAQAPPSAFAPAPPEKPVAANNPPTNLTGADNAKTTPPPAAAADPVEAWLTNAPLRAQVSQLMMITIDSTRKMLPDDIKFLRLNAPGAMLLRQAGKAELVKDFAMEARTLERSTGIPLWVGADPYDLVATMQMGRDAMITIPSLMTLAAADDPESTARTARIMAEIMRGFGFDFYIGPPLCLAPTLEEARGTTRCLGGDPAFVAEAGKILCKGLGAGGIYCAVSGFPGGGLNHAERGSAVLTTPKSILAESDLLPFATAIKAGAKMVHVDNTLTPTLDPSGGPACLSGAVLTGLLREEMGFKGIILAGPVDAEELGDKMDAATSALTALRQGADMVLFRGALSQVQRAVERVAVAVERGEIPQAALQEKLRRILTEKQAWVKQRAAAIAEKPLKPKELAAWSTGVERRAITLVHHKGGALPLRRETATPVGVTGTVGVDELEAALMDPLKQVVQQPILTAGHIGDIQRFEIERLTSHMKGIRTVIVIMTDREKIEGQVALIQELKKNAPRVIVVYLGWPDHAAYFGDADAVLLGYSQSGGLNQTMTAMAEVLTGGGPLGFAEGLPDTLSMKPGEERTFSILDTVRTPAGRLPIDLSENMLAGQSARFDPTLAVRKTVWEFDGKKVDKPTVPWTFKEPGEHKVQLTVTDTRGEVRTRTFKAVVAP